MPFNGSGAFLRVYNWVTDKNNTINITASRVDTEDTGFATGLSNCICKDGQTTITANLPMSGFSHTGVGLATLANQYAVVSQVQSQAYSWIAAGGTADAITATYSPALTGLTDGLVLKFRATAANATTTPTFSPNSLTAHTITKRGGSALVAGDIAAALAEYELVYNLANTRWELMNPTGVVSNPFSDAAALVKNSADATKLVILSAASVTTGTTRTLTAQDKNYTIADNADLALKAPLASPALTGTPTAPTAAVATSTTQLATTAFAYGVLSASASGYTKLANGLMIQWGADTGSSTTISLPTTFPTACLYVIASATATATSTTTGEQQNVTSMSTTNFTVSLAPNANLGVGIKYLAIGN